jgi:hypothetical protein
MGVLENQGIFIRRSRFGAAAKCRPRALCGAERHDREPQAGAEGY